jgi:hypothetical protein
VETVTLVVGLAIALAGVVLRNRLLVTWTTQVCLAIVAVFAAVGMAEVVFRALDYDLGQRQRAWRQIAPYFRQPTVATGEVFFRREGTEEWTGQVINTQMKLHKVSPCATWA